MLIAILQKMVYIKKKVKAAFFTFSMAYLRMALAGWLTLVYPS
jgi:hypothetical protein